MCICIYIYVSVYTCIKPRTLQHATCRTINSGSGEIGALNFSALTAVSMLCAAALPFPLCLQCCLPCEGTTLHGLGCSSLSNNQFTGDFPSSITTLTKLTLLCVRAAYLACGFEGAWQSRRDGLWFYRSLANNLLTSSVPITISRLSDLMHL
jgi:hypothetical protein